MRIASLTRRSQKNVWKLVVLILFSVSCATTTTHYKRLPPKKVKIEHERALETGARKEIIRTEPVPFAAASTPKARASAKLVEDGRKQMAQNEFESADRTFQEAINIDPANGIAYYYLAKAKYELGAYEQANGVLDKAEELLAGSKEWMEAVNTLRNIIKEKF